MKINDIKKLHDMTLGELVAKQTDLQRDLAKSRLELKAAKLEDIKKPAKLRVDVARVKTVLRQKQLAAARGKQEEK